MTNFNHFQQFQVAFSRTSTNRRNVNSVVALLGLFFEITMKCQSWPYESSQYTEYKSSRSPKNRDNIATWSISDYVYVCPFLLQGRIHSEDGGYQEDNSIPYHGGQRQAAEGPTLFDTWNAKLVQAGIPRWIVGSVTVEPLMTIIFLVIMLFFGLPGLMFLMLLYAVIYFSNNFTGTRRTVRGAGNRPASGSQRSAPSGRRLGD